VTPGAGRALAGLILSVCLGFAACSTEQDMPEVVDMQDSMPLMRAIDDMSAADSMLDTLPGGEMVRGDSAAARRLLRDKVGESN